MRKPRCGGDGRILTMLKLVLAIITLGFVAWAFIQHLKSAPIHTARGRFFIVRAWSFTALLVFIFLAGFLFLPNKGRIILMIPVFLIAIGLAKWMKRTGARIHQEERERTNFERAKRVN